MYHVYIVLVVVPSAKYKQAPNQKEKRDISEQLECNYGPKQLNELWASVQLKNEGSCCRQNNNSLSLCYLAMLCVLKEGISTADFC